MAIVDRAPGALHQGDQILVPWPDRYGRRAIVLNTRLLPLGPVKQVWEIALRLIDSDDGHDTAHTIYRGEYELLPFILEHEPVTEGVRIDHTRSEIRERNEGKTTT